MERKSGGTPNSVTVLWCRTDGDARSRAHTLLVRSAAELMAVPASEVWVGHEPSGRPVLGGAGEGLQVSVSHARGAVAVALADRCPVGVDVEVVRRLNPDALARAWLAPVEADWMAGLAEDDRTTAFLWLWTQKESIGKVLGQGLRNGGMRRRVPLPGTWPPLPDAAVVPVALRGEPELGCAAVLLDAGRLVLGIALRQGPDDHAVRVHVRCATASPSG